MLAKSRPALSRRRTAVIPPVNPAPAQEALSTLGWTTSSTEGLMARRRPARRVGSVSGRKRNNQQGASAMETPIRSSGFPRGDLRVSDAERDRAVAELSEHFQAGRLTQEEFEDRSGRALQARTGRELSGLFTDLPQGAAPATVSAGSARCARRVPSAAVVIACVMAAIIVGNVLGSTGHFHGNGVGWLVPVLILGFVVRRLARGRL